MNEPATREDLEKAKQAIIDAIKVMDDSVEAMRGQNSAEHGSLFTKLLHVTELMHWLRAKWEKFMALPTPPDRRAGRPKDDTQ